MKFTNQERREIFSQYESGCVVRCLNKIEKMMAAEHMEDEELGENSAFSAKSLRESIALRKNYMVDFIIVEQLAFCKGIDAALEWLEKHR